VGRHCLALEGNPPTGRGSFDRVWGSRFGRGPCDTPLISCCLTGAGWGLQPHSSKIAGGRRRAALPDSNEFLFVDGKGARQVAS